VTPTMKNCGTKDTHINFGESLDSIDWDEAERVCDKADLCIVLGTSMSLRHVTHMPFMAKKTVIVNLQKTPDDGDCHLRLFADADTVMTSLMQRLDIPIDPVPEWRPAHPRTRPLAARAKAPSPPSSAKSMRGHIRTTQGGSVSYQVEPAPVGVTVRGREVTKVAPGSQAERLGVKCGWMLTSVGGVEMPPAGQAAADAITRALAAGKKGSKQFSITFAKPAAKTQQGTAAAKVSLPKLASTGKPGSARKSASIVSESSKKPTPFASFSSGLGMPFGMGSGLLPRGVFEAAQKSMDGLSAQMEALGTSSAC